MRFWTQDAIPMLIVASILFWVVGIVADRLPGRNRNEAPTDEAVRR